MTFSYSLKKVVFDPDGYQWFSDHRSSQLTVKLAYSSRCPSVMSRHHVLGGKNAQIDREYVPIEAEAN
jgi:hypothetical protein